MIDFLIVGNIYVRVINKKLLICQVLTSQGLIYPDVKMSRLDISNVRCQGLTFHMSSVDISRVDISRYLDVKA